jgi:MIP family channel proteins
MTRGWRRAAAEFVGTFALVFIGVGAAAVDAWTGGAVGHVGISLAFALVVLGVIYAIGHLSGAHINPAVTVAFWLSRRFPGREVPGYVAAQCTGAVLASLLLGWLVGDAVSAGATVPSLSTGRALAVEGVLSFLLMFIIMAVATDERVAGGWAGLVVGLTVGFDALMGGPLTGASMNPARSLGPALAGGVWTAHWIYWLAPVGGTVLGALGYEFLRPGEAPSVIPRGVALGTEGPLD